MPNLAVCLFQSLQRLAYRSQGLHFDVLFVFLKLSRVLKTRYDEQRSTCQVAEEDSVRQDVSIGDCILLVIT